MWTNFKLPEPIARLQGRAIGAPAFMAPAELIAELPLALRAKFQRKAQTSFDKMIAAQSRAEGSTTTRDGELERMRMRLELARNA